MSSDVTWKQIVTKLYSTLIQTQDSAKMIEMFNEYGLV